MCTRRGGNCKAGWYYNSEIEKSALVRERTGITGRSNYMAWSGCHLPGTCLAQTVYFMKAPIENENFKLLHLEF